MKTALLLTLMLMGQAAFAETIREKNIKKEMLQRVDTLESKLTSARSELRRKDPITACLRVHEAFDIYPDHLKAIGMNMDLMKGKVFKIKEAALQELILLHKQKNICNSGSNSEYVDLKVMSKKLLGVIKSLKNQRNVIKRNSTGFENHFFYEYDF